MNSPRSRNNLRHGLSAGSLPDSCRYISNAVSIMRRSLEDSVLEKHDVVTVVCAARIQSAAHHETRAMLATRWLRVAEQEDGKPLPLADRLLLLGHISNATDARDKCITALNIETSDGDRAIELLYGPP